MNLINKVKKASTPILAGALIVAGFALGLNGDYYHYAKVREVFPEAEISYVWGEVTNLEEATPLQKEKIEDSCRNSRLMYSLSLPMIAGGTLLGILGMGSYLQKKPIN